MFWFPLSAFWLLSSFLFVFNFLQLQYEMSWCKCLCVFILLGVLWTSCVSVVQCLFLILENAQTLLLQILLFFSVFIILLILLLCIYYSFCNCPNLLNFFCLFHFFSLFFYLRNLYWHIFKITGTFFGSIYSLMSLIKRIFSFYYSVSISFWFFLRVLIFLLILPIHSCMFSTFSIISLSISIIGTLISQSDNSKISALSESGCDAFSISSDCVFSLWAWFIIFVECQTCYIQ